MRLANQNFQPHFESLIASIPHMVWAAGADGFTYYYNQRFLDYLGLTLDQMQGWNWLETLHPEDRARGLRIGKQPFN